MDEGKNPNDYVKLMIQKYEMSNKLKEEVKTSKSNVIN